MSRQQVGEYFGYLSALLFFVSYLPQLWKLLSSRDCAGVSLSMFYVSLSAYCCVVAYMLLVFGFQMPMAVNAGSGLTINVLIIWRLHWLKQNQHKTVD